MKKTMSVLITVLLGTLLMARVASAHVVVFPKEATQGSYEKFTVRVPSEKDIPTVKVEVKIPNDVEISRFEPKPGWAYSITKDAAGKITSVVWTAAGAGLSATEFGEFNMQGKVGEEAKAIVWKAYQTYKDGSVVEWVGAEDSDKPASVTTVNEAPAGAGGHGHANGAADHGAAAGGAGEEEAADADGAADAGGDSNMPLYFSIAALAVSLITLLLSVVRKRA